MHGLIAILRGVQPLEVDALAAVLVDAGFGTIEVPLNSPDPLKSISRLARDWGSRALVGAGTVISVEQVDAVADAGARLVLSPHLDATVVARCKARGLIAMPGVATPSEGFAALRAGADALKLFPGDVLGPPVVKAWRAVFPSEVAFFSVGGVSVGNLAAFKAAGVQGAGIGSALYAPGLSAGAVHERARAFVAAWGAA